ncbi:MAG: branched-chain amino acid ABC transporter permease [Dehalococcoidia bacterium]
MTRARALGLQALPVVAVLVALYALVLLMKLLGSSVTLSRQPLVNGLAIGAVYAALALALTLIYRATDVANFGQGETATFCSFIAWSFIVPHEAWFGFITNFYLRFILGFGATLIVAAILGALIERLVIRPVETAPLLTIVIVTLGLFEIFNSASNFIWQSQPKPFPTPFKGAALKLFGTTVGRPQVGLFVVVLLVMGLVALLFQKTKLGLALRATAQNPSAARLMGVPTSTMLMVGWALATAVGAMAGILVANIVTIDPNMMLGPLLFAFAGAVLGGLDNPIGAVIGGLLVGIIQNVIGSTDVFKEIRDPIAFLIILIALVIRPSGLLGRAASKKV